MGGVSSWDGPGSNMAAVCVSTHALDINDFNDVYVECQSLCARWSDIGVYLNAPRNIMDTIEADNYGSSKRLAGLLDSWLRRWSSNQSIPSWRVLCKAITMVDRSRADAIANKHQCNCSQCTSNPSNILPPRVQNRQQETSSIPSNNALPVKMSSNVPIGTTVIRRATPTNNSNNVTKTRNSTNNDDVPITAAVFRKHYSKLDSILNTSDDAFNKLTVELYSEGFISQQVKMSVTRKRDVHALLDHILMMVESNPSRMMSVIDIMNSIDLLCDIVEQMKMTTVQYNATISDQHSVSSPATEQYNDDDLQQHSLQPTMESVPTVEAPCSDIEEETTDSPSQKDTNGTRGNGCGQKMIFVAIGVVAFAIVIAVLIQTRDS